MRKGCGGASAERDHYFYCSFLTLIIFTATLLSLMHEIIVSWASFTSDAPEVFQPCGLHSAPGASRE